MNYSYTRQHVMGLFIRTNNVNPDLSGQIFRIFRVSLTRIRLMRLCTLITNYMIRILKRHDSLVVFSVEVSYTFKYVAHGRAIGLFAAEDF